MASKVKLVITKTKYDRVSSKAAGFVSGVNNSSLPFFKSGRVDVTLHRKRQGGKKKEEKVRGFVLTDTESDSDKQNVE